MLIDESYFIGALTIAQLGEKSVKDNLLDCINRWEPVILEAALGYDFYMALLAGLDVSSDEDIEQRWLDLLNGVAFTTTYQRRMHWVGFAGGENTRAMVAQQRPDLFIYAGTTPGFAVGDYRYTDASLAGWKYTLELFGAGTLEPVVEWDYKPGGGLALADTAYRTQAGERWVIKFTGRTTIVQTGGRNLVSPLAGFVFYEYMVELATQNTGIGVVKNEGENSRLACPVDKMVAAYNNACDQVAVLYELLQADQSKAEADRVYPEYQPNQSSMYSLPYGWCGGYPEWSFGSSLYGSLYSFKKINSFNL